MMFEYIFTAIIHPERVDFTVDSPMAFQLNHPDFNVVGVSAISIRSSHVIVFFKSAVDYTTDPKCNLETLKNFVEENVRLIVDAYCFVRSYSYDVEVSTLKCTQLGIDHTFEVLGEHNISKSDDQASEEWNELLTVFSNPSAGFMKDVLADFRRAIKYPAMTASFCFRAIETIRTFLLEDPAVLDEGKRKKDGWAKLRESFNLTEAHFSEIQKFALPNRHGVYPSITYVERERIMNFTRRIIEQTVRFVK
jgi:hypothetical protein